MLQEISATMHIDHAPTFDATLPIPKRTTMEEALEALHEDRELTSDEEALVELWEGERTSRTRMYV